ncbi:MAG: SRPBCC family protein [Tannerella sp.]|jgi:carbon monoxide dehydrogenase subunit G|nr:SRPBCC family protein [Tannerella sp.]
MSDFTSEIKTIQHNDDKIFEMLSDLSNLERVRDRIPQDKIKNFTFDQDTCSFTVEPVGAIQFKVIEREPNKTIKFATTNSPVPLTLWIQLKQVAEKDTKMKMTIRADLNPFIKPMVSKPLQEAVNKISDVIAQLPYEENL